MGAVSFRTATRVVPLGDQARLRRHPPAFGLEQWQLDGLVDDAAAQALILQLMGARQALGDLDHVVLDWKDAVIESDAMTAASAVCSVAEQCGARLAHKPENLPESAPVTAFAEA
ncbi:MAG: hypothetical protein KIT79_03750 [Deltaproteobacteria bacterium]|nr:hypothetical protein [Deltaproteobacteria bacterium]